MVGKLVPGKCQFIGCRPVARNADAGFRGQAPFSGLPQDLQAYHLNSGIAYIQHLKFVIANDDAFF